MDELRVVNPEIVKYGKKFIQWEDDGWDSELFAQLLVRGVYIDGFVSHNFAGEKWCSKSFFEEKHVQDMPDACTIVRNLEQDDEKERKFMPLALTPDVVNCEVMIYGCGNYGLEALKYLETQPVRILGFVDSDPAKHGGMIKGYKIYSPKVIRDIDSSVALVLAAFLGKQDMENTARKYSENIKTYYLNSLDTRMRCGDLIIKNHLNGLYRIMCKRRIYLYGTYKKMKEYAEFFRLLDLPVQGMLVDDYDESGAEMEIMPGLEKMAVEEILYESDFCVIVCADMEKKAVDKMESLGMKAADDYFISSCLRVDICWPRRHALDLNLGYTNVNQAGEYGVYKQLARCEERYKIAVLGGSTTDGDLYPFKSWPECLWNRINKDYISIYNYGVAGYSIGQEIIRLIRDIVGQKPDMILAFNGVNDMIPGMINMFDISYMRSVMEFAGRNLEDGVLGDHRKVYRGEKMYKDCFSRWLSTVELMGAVADFYQITFFDFLQPILYDKPAKSKGEELLVSVYKNNNERSEGLRARFSQLKEQKEHIIDLSDIFDDVHDVYIDNCHVTEKGNEIIAENIFNAISPVLQKWQEADAGQ